MNVESRFSLGTLNQLYEYDDFMYSIRTVVDLGCGTGEDLEWWATRTTREEYPQPLNIDCTGVDLIDRCYTAKKHSNVNYQLCDFEGDIQVPKLGFDILWCHDSFQYAISPVQTLSQWWRMASQGAMLYICVPITQRIHHRQLDYYAPSGHFYHYSMVNLIYMLATAGWDCKSGFFRQSPVEPWIQAVVYKSDIEPMDPKTTTWYKLSELGLLPASADVSVFAHGYLKQQDLVVPWLDRSLISMTIK